MRRERAANFGSGSAVATGAVPYLPRNDRTSIIDVVKICTRTN